MCSAASSPCLRSYHTGEPRKSGRGLVSGNKQSPAAWPLTRHGWGRPQRLLPVMRLQTWFCCKRRRAQVSRCIGVLVELIDERLLAAVGHIALSASDIHELHSQHSKKMSEGVVARQGCVVQLQATVTSAWLLGVSGCV